jgi:hypothetical protein
MLECQTAAGQTACFEMVVTARRLRPPPAAVPDGGEDDAHSAVPTPPTLMDVHRASRRDAHAPSAAPL